MNCGCRALTISLFVSVIFHCGAIMLIANNFQSQLRYQPMMSDQIKVYLERKNEQRHHETSSKDRPVNPNVGRRVKNKKQIYQTNEKTKPNNEHSKRLKTNSNTHTANSEKEKQSSVRTITAQTTDATARMYFEHVRAKVEKIGSLNHPVHQSGSLVVRLVILHDGSLDQFLIVQSSGNKQIDHAARRISQLASPFAQVPQQLLKDSKAIIIERRWMFY